MNIINKLTIRHLILNRKRTIITILGIVLSVAMIIAVSGFSVSFQDILRRNAIEKEGNWHVKYSSISKEVADQIAVEPMFTNSYLEKSFSENYTIFLSVKNLNQELFNNAKEIGEKYELLPEQIDFQYQLLQVEGVTIYQKGLDSIYLFAAILMIIITAGSIIVISNAFYISSSERGRQFGMLKSIGATKKQIRKSIVFEGVILAIIAIPLGIILGFFVNLIALTIANALLGDMISRGLSLKVIISPIAILTSTIVSFVTILLSAWLPARKVSKISAVDSIKQTKEIKIKSSKVKTSKLTKLIFGFEGTLAAKALKRNSGKYRATVISLVISIVLFIGVSSFGQLLEQATRMVYKDYGFNIHINFSAHTKEQEKVFDRISKIGNETIENSRSFFDSTKLAESMLIKQETKIPVVNLSHNETDTTPVLVNDIGKEDFDKLCSSLKLDINQFYDTEHIKAILVTNSIESEKTNITPSFQIKDGEKISLIGWKDENNVLIKNADILISGVTSVVSKPMLPEYWDSQVNLIVSSDVFDSLKSEDYLPSFTLAIEAENADEFQAQAEKILADELTVDDYNYSIQNYDKDAQNNRNIILLVMLFVYGFIAMLSLIGVTSVIGTITTSISLRKQEFAMLQSVGMTQKGISQMLNLESLFYGVKALVFGLPLGLLVSFLLHQAISRGVQFAYILPWQSMLISIVAVMALTFSTMHYAQEKQRYNNIVDSLRGENI